MKITISDASAVVADGLRYEPGESYNVGTGTGGHFKGMGWATTAAADVELSEPIVCHDATDAEAARYEAEDAARFEARGVQEPDLEVQDGVLGTASTDL